MSLSHYDLCIIGAGAGGLTVASVGAQLGLNVALIEHNKMGGDCLNAGCVPSKALLSAAKHIAVCRHLDAYGSKNIEPEVDYQKIADYVKSSINKIAPHDSVERFEGLGVTVIKGDPKFISKHQLQVGDHTIEARYFVIATGSRAAIPAIPGLDQVAYLTNETIFGLTQKPSRLLIIGAGPVGIEIAQAHLMLGTPVTVVDMASLLPRDDQEAVDIVKQRMLTQGLVLKEHIQIKKIEQVSTKIIIHYEKEGQSHTLEGSHLLVAAGRLANIENLDLEKAGVQYDRMITVSKTLRTTNKSIYAIGDVTGSFQFTHIAGYQAGIVIRNILFKWPAKVDYTDVPWVTYTSPELAQVGLNEPMAQQQALDYQVTKLPFEAIDRYQIESATDGFIKVLSDKKGTILGVTAVGEGAGELLLTWGLAIKNGLRLGKIAELIAPYPTRSEISKRVASTYFEPILFSDRTKTIVKFLMKF